AFSTTAEDRAVRDGLFQRHPDIKRVLSVLAELYPGGIKPQVEKRRQEVEARGLEEDSQDVIDQLIENISRKLG
ncbi:MAG: hypothetical protein R6U40_08080, partial [Desulfobacterales bacterium]